MIGCVCIFVKDTPDGWHILRVMISWIGQVARTAGPKWETTNETDSQLRFFWWCIERSSGISRIGAHTTLAGALFA